MYTVSMSIRDGDSQYWQNIYHPQTKDADHHLSNMVCVKEVNKAGSFTFTMPKGNVGYDKIVPRRTEIIVYKNGKTYWQGRIISYNRDFKMNYKIQCEGILAYLNDAICDPVWNTNRGSSEWNYKGRVDTTNQLPVSNNNADKDLYYVGFESPNPAANYEMYVWTKNALMDTTQYAIEGSSKTLNKVNALPAFKDAKTDCIYVLMKNGEEYHDGYEKNPDATDWTVTQNIAYVATKDTWVYKGLSGDMEVTLNMTTYFDLIRMAYLSKCSQYLSTVIEMDDSVREELDDVDVNEVYTNWNTMYDEITNIVIGDRKYAMVTEYDKSHVRICHLPIGSSNQTIIFGDNLLDYVVDVDASELITRIVPVGDNNTTVYDMPIAGGGKYGKYYVDSGYVDTYGVNEKVIKYDGITEPLFLYSAAVQDLAKINPADMMEISINAIDLSNLGVNVDEIEIGKMVSVISAPHQVNDTFICTYISVDLDDPSNSEYRFGSYNRNATPHSVSITPARKSSDMIANPSIVTMSNERGKTLSETSVVRKMHDNAASYEYDDRTVLIAAQGNQSSRNGFASYIIPKNT